MKSAAFVLAAAAAAFLSIRAYLQAARAAKLEFVPHEVTALHRPIEGDLCAAHWLLRNTGARPLAVKLSGSCGCMSLRAAGMAEGASEMILPAQSETAVEALVRVPGVGNGLVGVRAESADGGEPQTAGATFVFRPRRKLFADKPHVVFRRDAGARETVALLDMLETEGTVIASAECSAPQVSVGLEKASGQRIDWNGEEARQRYLLHLTLRPGPVPDGPTRVLLRGPEGGVALDVTVGFAPETARFSVAPARLRFDAWTSGIAASRDVLLTCPEGTQICKIEAPPGFRAELLDKVRTVTRYRIWADAAAFTDGKQREAVFHDSTGATVRVALSRP